MSSGDGWTTCASGHRHWGLFGAAGLLLVDKDKDRVILQHRAPWTHEGDSWGVPGGARDSDEDPLAAAVREAGEEAALSAADVDPIGLYVDDHDGWSYTTVVARATRALHPIAANAESVSVRWHAISEVAELPLHSGFAAAWQRLRDVPPPLYLVVADELVEHPLVATLVRDGIAVPRLPQGIRAGGLGRLLPHLVQAEGNIRATAATYAGRGQVVTASTSTELAALSIDALNTDV
ncbi:MAG: NUDIX hydrolase [Actinomycetota bacterium]|nr:NUDIX hydrolase [Actinomycetota bacterium]MDQ2955685.1 NUDIX hydrolase [Actinomycetota bacterium]